MRPTVVLSSKRFIISFMSPTTSSAEVVTDGLFVDDDRAPVKRTIPTSANRFFLNVYSVLSCNLSVIFQFL